MPVIGRILRPTKKSESSHIVLIKDVETSTYSTGGIQVRVGEVGTVDEAIPFVKDDNTPYKFGISIEGNLVTIKIYKPVANTSTGEITMSELDDGTDISSLDLKLLVFGH